MKIREVIHILKAQLVFGRTLKGRPITDFAKDNIKAALEDENNIDYNAVKCNNCGIIMSGLLVPEGCPNCGIKGPDIKINIEQSDIM